MHYYFARDGQRANAFNTDVKLNDDGGREHADALDKITNNMYHSCLDINTPRSQVVIVGVVRVHVMMMVSSIVIATR